MVKGIGLVRCFTLQMVWLLSLVGHVCAQQTEPREDAKAPVITLASGSYSLTQGQVVLPSAEEIVEGRYYRLIQFNTLPTDADRLLLKTNGQVELLDYLPKNTWMGAFKEGVLPMEALVGLNVRAVVPIASVWKLSGNLARRDYPNHAMRPDGRVALRVLVHETVAEDWARTQLQSMGIEIAKELTLPKIIEVVVPAGQENLLAGLPWVRYVEPTSPTPAKEGFVDVANHRSNTINNSLPGGLRYDGSGVAVTIGDDGFVGPHIDFAGRLTNTTAVNDGNHADHCSGIITAAGNLNPTVVGQAPGATLRTYAYYADITGMTGAGGLYNTNSVRVSSHSLGQTCNGGYTLDAFTTDRQVREHPFLSYVHSSGNSGAADCGYGAGAGWANITGGFKMGKNVLAVGNVFNTDGLASTSSRGPANDGRIKPDICAVGSNVVSTDQNNGYFTASGTSMACPAVAGVLTQLYHAYRDLNGGAEPEAGLVKATVMNTAEDLGNPGPDFRFGYGRINALRAFEVLQNTRFASNSISTGQSQTVPIVVPSGVAQLRVMVYWTDYEAAPNAATALVNDLDFTLTNPSATVFQPWVLNPAPNAATLNAAATRGIDRLNNVEQVTLDAPAPGTYTATITGFAVPQGPQKYYVVYSWIEDNVRLTFPLGGEAIVPGEGQIIRWDAQTTASTFNVEYSLNGGNTWTLIGAATAASRARTWTVPGGAATGQARVRVTRGAQSSTSANFSIVATPPSFRTDYSCYNVVRLAWNATNGATSYEVSRLGSKYMNPIDTTTDLFYDVTDVVPNTNYWFSVRALGANGMGGRRALAISATTVPSGCPFPSAPLALIKSIDYLCPDVIHTLTDSSVSNPTSWLWAVSPGPAQFVNGTSSASQNPQIQFSQAGLQTISLTASNTNGSNSTSRTVQVKDAVAVTPTTPFSRSNFNGTFPPNGWRIKPSNAVYSWEQSGTLPGPDGNTGQFALFNNYDMNGSGLKDALILPRLDLSGVIAPQLRFHVAYAPFSATDSDSLRVEVAGSCSNQFTKTSFQKGGLTLSTTGGYNTSNTWAPTSAGQWREEIVDLTSLLTEAGEWSDVQIVNINDFGQRLYLGGITVEGQAPLPLQLTGFNAVRKTRGHAELTWQTEQEENTASFRIERSVNGRHWRTVGSVSAAQNSTTTRTYAWTDGLAPTGLVYYRLRMNDLDGSFSYSDTRQLPATEGVFNGLTVWPVPLTGSLHVRDRYPLTFVEVVDGMGKVVTRWADAAGSLEAVLDVEHLPKGHYTLRTFSATEGTKVKAVIR